MTEFTVNVDKGFEAKVRGVAFPVDVSKLPQAALDKVFAYGLQRIFNDAAASAKTDSEATGLATKRLENLLAGIVRVSPQREGNPVRARALDLASARIKANPKFTAWLTEAKLKAGDKAAVAKVRELALAAISKDGNAFMVQAQVDVDAAKGLDIDIDI